MCIFGFWKKHPHLVRWTAVLCLLGSMVLLIWSGQGWIRHQQIVAGQQAARAREQAADAQLVADSEHHPHEMVRSTNPLLLFGKTVILLKKDFIEEFQQYSDGEDHRVQSRLKGQLLIVEKVLGTHHFIGVIVKALASSSYQGKLLNLQGYFDIRAGKTTETFEELSENSNGNFPHFVQVEPAAPLSYWIEKQALSTPSRVEFNWTNQSLTDDGLFVTSGGDPNVDDIHGVYGWVRTDSAEVGYGHDPIRKCYQVGGVWPDGTPWEGGTCNG